MTAWGLISTIGRERSRARWTYHREEDRIPKHLQLNLGLLLDLILRLRVELAWFVDGKARLDAGDRCTAEQEGDGGVDSERPAETNSWQEGIENERENEAVTRSVSGLLSGLLRGDEGSDSPAETSSGKDTPSRHRSLLRKPLREVEVYGSVE